MVDDLDSDPPVSIFLKGLEVLMFRIVPAFSIIRNTVKKA